MKYISSICAAATLVAAFSFSCSDDSTDSISDEELRQRVIEYLEPQPKTSIRLEVDHVAGLAPNQDVIDGLTARLGFLAKPITVDLQASLSSSDDGGWSFAELEALEAKSYNGPSQANEAVIHVMFVDGHYAQSATSNDVLGVAWANRTVVLFADTLKNTCTPDSSDDLKRRGLVEKACNATVIGTWLHELGHVIGLVNDGLDMVENHEDPDHPKHDADPSSIMYWQFDVAGIFDQVKGKVLADEDPVPSFSAACLADIEVVQSNP